MAETAPAEEFVPVPAETPSQDRWQLTGVVSANGDRVIMLKDRQENATVRLTSEGVIDGWAVKDAGSDYAILIQGDDEVRLQLNDENTL